MKGYPANSSINKCIGIGRFRILGETRFRILGGGGGGGEGGKGGPNSQQAHVPTWFFFINQCQIITFLHLKSDIIENSRIELRGIVLPAPSNQFN